MQLAVLQVGILPYHHYVLIGSTNVTKISVKEPMETIQLERYCQGVNPVSWMKVGQPTSEEWFTVTVSHPDDRGKFICRDSNSAVHSIVYVSIEGTPVKHFSILFIR